MNKFWKKIAVLALAGTMTLGMSVNALAETPNKNPASQYTNSGNSVESDINYINLIKDYDRAIGTQTDSNSPAENFIFTIEPYAVWNAGTVDGTQNGQAYTISNMPLLGRNIPEKVYVDDNTRKTTVTIHANAGDAKDGGVENLSQMINLPLYYSVGDFWYKVTETDNKTTGVTYATNDAAAKDGVYYIHVQVVNGANQNQYYRSVTLHQTAPAATISTKDYNKLTEKGASKVYDIQNTYSAGTLSVTKNVTGNSGDKNKRFEVTVTFKKPSRTIITSDITYQAAGSAGDTGRQNHFIMGQDDTNSIWMSSLESDATKIGENSAEEGYAQVKIYIKHGEIVTFKNIPYGVTYKIQESDYITDDNYDMAAYSLADNENDPSYSLNNNGSKYSEVSAAGEIDDSADGIAITNNKDTTIDIGVVTTNAPYIAMLILAVAALVLFVHRRKTMIEE